METETDFLNKLHEIRCLIGRCPHYDQWWHLKIMEVCKVSREIRKKYGQLICFIENCQYDGPAYTSFYNGPMYCPEHADYIRRTQEDKGLTLNRGEK